MSDKQYPVQLDTQHREQVQRSQRLTVPERIARAAYAEYSDQCGTRQSFEQLHDRGGFGTLELMDLLVDRIERLEARHE